MITRIATYNLRYDSKPDATTVQQSLAALKDPLLKPDFLGIQGEQPWSTRRIRVAEQILGESPILVGYQEALLRQVHDLAELCGDQWSWIGVGRDDGAEAGEYCPIFYKKELSLISNPDPKENNFWLSNTPFKASKYPGAGSFRICTVARFATADRKTFTVLNTHLDDSSDDQRRLGASLLLTRARFEAVKTQAPVFIIGDLNSTSTENDSGAYKILTGSIPPVPIDPEFAARFAVPDDELPDFKLLDLRGQAPRHSVSANYATYTGFGAPTKTKGWMKIDFILGGNHGGTWTTEGYRVSPSLSDDGILASDHRPVFADILI